MTDPIITPPPPPIYTYAATTATSVVRNDGAHIASGGDGWADYQTWLAAGNTPTPAPTIAPPIPQFTFMQFLALFTTDEQHAIVNSTDTQVKLFLLMAAGANLISLADPKTTGGLAYLASLNLITQARETAILASPAPTS